MCTPGNTCCWLTLVRLAVNWLKISHKLAQMKNCVNYARSALQRVLAASIASNATSVHIGNFRLLFDCVCVCVRDECATLLCVIRKRPHLHIRTMRSMVREANLQFLFWILILFTSKLANNLRPGVNCFICSSMRPFMRRSNYISN